MNLVKIRGIRPYDGDYELDERQFNTREMRWIKKIADYLPLEMDRGFQGGDPDLVIALTVIALARAGKIDRNDGLEVAEMLSEIPLLEGKITLLLDAEDDVDPPESTLEREPSSPSEPDSTPKQDGPTSSRPSVRLDESPPATGLSTSGTSPDALPLRSVS